MPDAIVGRSIAATRVAEKTIGVLSKRIIDTIQVPTNCCWNANTTKSFQAIVSKIEREMWKKNNRNNYRHPQTTAHESKNLVSEHGFFSRHISGSATAARIHILDFWFQRKHQIFFSRLCFVNKFSETGRTQNPTWRETKTKRTLEMQTDRVLETASMLNVCSRSA